MAPDGRRERDANSLRTWWTPPADGRAWRLRTLGRRDLPALLAFHTDIVDGMPPALIARESEDFLRRHLTIDGVTFAIEAGGRMVAYGILGLAGPEHADLARRLEIPPSAALGVLDGCGVTAGLRRHGLHRALIRIRATVARQHRITRLAATAAPGNQRSLSNLMAAGLLIRRRAVMFGGHARFILLATADDPPPSAWAGSTAVDLEDAARQQELLAAGHIGIAVDGTAVLFARPSRAPDVP